MKSGCSFKYSNSEYSYSVSSSTLYILSLSIVFPLSNSSVTIASSNDSKYPTADPIAEFFLESSTTFNIIGVVISVTITNITITANNSINVKPFFINFSPRNN